MKKALSLLGIVMLLTCPVSRSFSQSNFPDDPYYQSKVTFEYGASLGLMNCLTDLGGGKGVGKNFIKDVNMRNTQPEGSVYISGAYKNALALRTEIVWGIVKANDAVLKNVKESTLGRYDRNLNFRSTIFEVSLLGEIHPLYFRKYSPRDKLPRISPYLAGGIGYFIFNPQTKVDGNWVDLRPLSTEGQGFAEYPNRKIYKLKQFNFPVGAGIKYKFSDQFNLSAECIYRILNTDYLDDVSTTYIDPSLFQKYFGNNSMAQMLSDRQKEINPSHNTNVGDIRGNPKKNDAYFSINFKIGIIF
jgi:hypothetical protein